MIVSRWQLWLHNRSVALLPTRKTLTQQQAIKRELGGPQSQALITLYKLVYCWFCVFLLEEFSSGSIENWQFRHQKRECPLHNNKPTVRKSKGVIQKLLLRTIIGWIVILVSLFWRKIINNKQKWANCHNGNRHQPIRHTHQQSTIYNLSCYSNR